ncbi:unnamed protein product [Notodromas monacha]|uniref:ATP-dependent RNA helicase n=1 Tax=Notodromas monacha TaxID=399045 RepID=A0A7R9BIR2_9CRUS|nr:unnamed protein product [Notodromas monacha]CAG0915452.1 unnamed protein product [Notodromas monacha]
MTLAGAVQPSSRVNLTALKDETGKRLIDLLDECTGRKAIVWDESLTGPIGLVAEYSVLKEHDVVKMFPLRPGRLSEAPNVRHVIFICKARVELMDVIADCLMREDSARSATKEFHLLLVPRASLLCEKRLKDKGVYGTLSSVQELGIDFYVFDTDVISMEWADSFKECYLENDTTSLFHAARGLMSLQRIFGPISKVYGKGLCARQLWDLVSKMKREEVGSESVRVKTDAWYSRLGQPQIDAVVLVDRSVDPISPIVTQLTYEGLIDELFGIRNNSVKLPGEKFSRDDTGSDLSMETKQVILSSKEDLYAEIRDKHFNAVGSVLSRKAKQDFLQYTANSEKNVGELKQLVAKLPYLQAAKLSLATHTTIAELIKEATDEDDFRETIQTEQEFLNCVGTNKINSFIEDCISRKEALSKVLRLMCLQCSTNGGLPQRVLEHYQREILRNYGFQHSVTLLNLEKAGLLTSQTCANYPYLRKALKLTVDDVSEQKPMDIAYVHSGYAPLSVRLVHHLTRKDFKSVDDALCALPGPLVNDVQQLPSGMQHRNYSEGKVEDGENITVVLVFFLGGCTFGEISALRFLSQQDNSTTEYLIATTKIINGKTFLESLEETQRPASVMPPKWKDLQVNLRPEILQALEVGGFSVPTIVQARTVPLFLKNKDVAVQAITGSGKTLAFVVPILEILLRREDPWKKHEIGAVVISPTRELASQTWQVIEQFLSGPVRLPAKFRSMLLVGGTDPSEDVTKFEADGANIIVATPGRLEDLLKKKSGGSDLACHVRRVEIVVLDEADKLLEFGFERTVTTILSYFPKQRRTGLFSATQSEALNPLIKTGMRNPVQVLVRDVVACQDALNTPGTLENFYMTCTEVDKFDNLVRMLQTTECVEGKVLVFLATCACVDYFSSVLRLILGTQRKVLSMHGKMKTKRNKIFQRFKDLDTGILVCTDVMARGIDVPDIDWVIQYDPPSSATAVVHRCGRTARNGQPGKALLMLLREEDAYVKFLSLNQKVHLEKMETFVTDTVDADGNVLMDRLEALSSTKKLLAKDHGLIDKSSRAFVSFVQFYMKHDDQQREKMRKEKFKVFSETGLWPLSKKKLKERARFAEIKKLNEERKRERILEFKRKRKRSKSAQPQKLTEVEKEELDGDIKLMKKLKRGHISKEVFDAEFCGDEVATA